MSVARSGSTIWYKIYRGAWGGRVKFLVYVDMLLVYTVILHTRLLQSAWLYVGCVYVVGVRSGGLNSPLVSTYTRFNIECAGIWSNGYFLTQVKTLVPGHELTGVGAVAKG